MRNIHHKLAPSREYFDHTGQPSQAAVPTVLVRAAIVAARSWQEILWRFEVSAEVGKEPSLLQYDFLARLHTLFSGIDNLDYLHVYIKRHHAIWRLMRLDRIRHICQRSRTFFRQRIDRHLFGSCRAALTDFHPAVDHRRARRSSE